MPTFTTPGNGVEPLFDGAVERFNLGLRVSGGLRIDVNDVAVLRVEVHVGALQFVQALREEAGADQQHERQSAPAGRRATRCSSEAPPAVVRVPVRRASAGCACAAIQAGATPKRMPVSSESAKAKPMTRGEGAASMGTFCAPGNASASSMRAPAIGHAQPGDAAEAGEQNAFGEQLADDAAALRAEGGADGHLRAAAHAADEQQVGDVGAGDEKDQCRRSTSGDEAETCTVLQLLDARAARRENDVAFGQKRLTALGGEHLEGGELLAEHAH